MAHSLVDFVPIIFLNHFATYVAVPFHRTLRSYALLYSDDGILSTVPSRHWHNRGKSRLKYRAHFIALSPTIKNQHMK